MSAGRVLARALVPPEVVGAPATDLLQRIHRVRIMIGVSALFSVWAMPTQIQRRFMLFAYVALVYLPWSFAISRRWRRGNGLRLMMLLGDFCIVAVVHLVVAEARYVALFGYILLACFYAQLGGSRSGLFVSFLAALTTIVREVVLGPGSLDAYTLAMFLTVLPSCVLLVDAVARAQRDSANRASELYRALEAISSSNDTHEVVSIVARDAARSLGASGGVILLRDGADLVAMGASDPRVNDLFGAVRTGAFDTERGRALPAVRAIQSGQTVGVEDSEAYDHHAWVMAAKRMHVRAVLCAPIVAPASGCLLVWFDRPMRFQETQRDFLEAFAKQASVALERARAFDTEREAVRRLIELDELKSDFLSTVSHELRTPLTVILGFAAMLDQLRAKMTEEMTSHVVKRLVANATELDRLISQMLDFSRLEHGGPKLELIPIDAGSEIRQLVERLDTVLSAHRLAIDIPDETTIVADKGAFSRVLENLLTNAAKFSRAGSAITIAIRPSRAHAVVSVCDEGVGIPPSERSRVFERFYRLNRGDRTSVRGTGIGLAVVKQLVEASGGRVWVDAAPGGGSCFRFTLPLAPITDRLQIDSAEARATASETSEPQG